MLIVRYRSKKFVFYFNAFAFVFERKRKWDKMRGWSSLSCGSIIAIKVQWCIQQNVFTKQSRWVQFNVQLKAQGKWKFVGFWISTCFIGWVILTVRLIIYYLKVLIALVNELFNLCGLLSEQNEPWGEKHVTICHSVFPPDSGESGLSESATYLL